MNNPLVSICVITYNSSRTILETLESAQSQSYDPIELIIADDGSNDNTVELCRDWIKTNGDRFVRCELIAADCNKGIAANFNRAWKSAQGEWVKSIAGDDVLMPDCIRQNVEFVTGKDCKIVFSTIKAFKNDKDNKHTFLFDLPMNEEKPFFSLSAKDQYEALLIDNLGPTAPSSFIHSDLLKEVGYANENFPFLEDYPLWLELTKRGHQLVLLDCPTIYYRFEDSITRNKGIYASSFYFFSLKKFWYEKIKPELASRNIKHQIKKEVYFIQMTVAIKFLRNKPNKFNDRILKYLAKIIKLGLKIKYGQRL